MLKGTYVFKQNGQEIGHSENIITTNGTNAILQYLSNSSFEWASTIAIGAIASTPGLSELSLKYEVARSAVTMKSYKTGTPNLIIVKGTVASSIAANIYEIGIFSYKTGQVFGTRDQLIISDFSDLTKWLTSSGTAYTTNSFAAQANYSPRIGLYSVNIPTNSTIINSNLSLDLSSYSLIDTLEVLANIPVGSAGNLIATLTDINGSTSVITFPFNGAVTSGYQVLSQYFTSAISNLSTVSTLSLQTSGTTSNIVVDAIKISLLGELSSSTGIVSRSMLTTPIAKIYGTPLDIEYYVQLS